ncbi:MAG TPA: DUF427 domain-containing protein [Acidimicrobiia bacterium]
MRRPEPQVPGPDQESVWDYPRPPALERDDRLVEVRFGGELVASTTGAYRVLETSHPPGYYLPPDDVRLDLLVRMPGRSVCEWKGVATYWSVQVGDQTAHDAAWSYPDPTLAFTAIAGYLSFYPGRVEQVTVGGEVVRPQAGEFYGGWILDEIVGPFKGDPGTWGW